MDRYPNLRFAFLEGGCTWVAAYLERMDDHFENPRYNARQVISRPPSEYFNSGRIFFGCEGNEGVLARVVGAAHQVGQPQDLLVWESERAESV